MGNSGSSPQMMNSFLRPIQRMLKQRDLKVSDQTIKGFLEDIDWAAPWFRASGDINLPCWEKLGRDLTEAKGGGELQSGTLPLWCLIHYCLKEGKCIDILHEGHRALSAYQDSMSESDNKEKGNLKEERPKSSKASSKLHIKVEKEKKTDQGKKEKETDQGKAKQKPSGLYPVLDEFSDLTLSDSAEDELESEEEEDLEEAAAAYEQESKDRILLCRDPGELYVFFHRIKKTPSGFRKGRRTSYIMRTLILTLLISLIHPRINHGQEMQ
ncbi:hypothetical protein STEG23_025632 [Scotinomys teguina]